MEKKQFGVELVALTQGFKKKIKESQQSVNELIEKTKQNIAPKIETNSVKSKINEIKNNVQEFKNSFKSKFIMGLHFNADNERAELSRLQEQLIQLENQARKSYAMEVFNKPKIEATKQTIRAIKDDLNAYSTSKVVRVGEAFKNFKNKLLGVRTAFRNNSNEANGFINQTNNSFKKGVKTIQRFAFALIGIRSIFRLVSRASSAYMSQDKELANQMQAVWIGLGSIVAPIIQGIANALIKMVSYVNIFIKALFGVDLLGKAMAKASANSNRATGSIGRTTKAVKELKGQLSGFDEINNIGEEEKSDGDIGGGGASAPDMSWTDAFNNVKLNPQWMKVIENFGKWIKENWKEVLIILGGTYTSLKLMALGTQLLGNALGGLMGLGIGIAITGIVLAIDGIIKFINEPSWENFRIILQGLAIAIFGVAIAMIAFNATNPMGWVVLAIALVVALVDAIVDNWEQIKTFTKNMVDAVFNFFSDLWNGICDLFNGMGQWFSGVLDDTSKITSDFIKNTINFFSDLWKAITNIFSNIGSWFGSKFNSGVNEIKKAFNSIPKFFSDLWNGIFNTIASIWRKITGLFSYGGKIFNGFVGGVANVFKKAVNGVIGGVNGVIGDALGGLNWILNQIKDLSILGQYPFYGFFSYDPIPVPRIPQLAVGTNYVPHDQLAYIHEGEAVVPKKFNQDKFFNRGNDETVELLKELIEVVENKNLNIELDGNKVSKVVKKHLDKQERLCY